MAMPKAAGMWYPMPSLRQISTSRSAQLQKAPIAHTVTICQIPPSRSGASARPYLRSGGAMLICHRFQVPPCDAPQTISRVPTAEKNSVVIPKNPT